MTTPVPFLLFDSSCDQALQTTNTNLLEAGLSTMQTFSLSTARLGTEDCCCPNHGTDECDCQLVVLLVYGHAEEPVTLILHGNGGQTWISIVESQEGDNTLSIQIRRALERVAVSISPTG